MEAELAELCDQDVTIEPYSSQNENGEASYGAAVSYKAQIAGQNKLVRDAGGQQVLSSLKLILSEYVNVGPKDRVTLPSTYANTQPPIMYVEKFRADEGNHHTTVHLQ